MVNVSCYFGLRRNPFMVKSPHRMFWTMGPIFTSWSNSPSCLGILAWGYIRGLMHVASCKSKIWASVKSETPFPETLNLVYRAWFFFHDMINLCCCKGIPQVVGIMGWMSLSRLFPTSQILSVDETSDLKTMYAALPWDDLWGDADMVNVIRYHRGSKLLEIPDECRPLLPKEL